MISQPASQPGALPRSLDHNSSHPISHSLALQVVPVDRVVPHEQVHDRRVSTLAARLAAEGRLVNPPVAAPLDGKYIILDGATRLTAFRHLGYPHIILHLVDVHGVDVKNPERQPVRLETWRHAVRGLSPDDLLRLLRDVPGLALTSQPVERPAGPGPADSIPHSPDHPIVGSLVTADGRGFLLHTAKRGAEDAGDWLAALNHMVERYGRWGHVERTLSGDLATLAAQYADLAALVTFPRFTMGDILALAAQGRTVPAGITRFIVPGRVLRLNAPLEMLAADAPLAAKQAWLEELLRERLAGRQVRYYEEPVVLLDE
jgi:hypothetical protein